MRKALVTGVTGQDGSYLAELLLQKGYEVHGIKRRSSSFNTERIDHIYEEPHVTSKKFVLHYGDLTDGLNCTNILSRVQPDEIYNLGAQSHVAVSFENPIYTAQVNAIGTLNLLEAIRHCGLEKKARFYQASTSELYGKVQDVPQNEETSFYPRSPYAVSKLMSFWSTVNYREAYGVHASNGILFNHESPRRGETFVTRKITLGMSKIVSGIEKKLYLGNLNAKRDWGHAKDFVEMQWLMLQQDTPDDYVIATGQQHTVRDFCLWAAEFLGITLEFVGEGAGEQGIAAHVAGPASNFVKTGQVILQVDPRYYRPTEVNTLLGDPSKARRKLGWSPKTSARELCREMVENDFKMISRIAS